MNAPFASKVIVGGASNRFRLTPKPAPVLYWPGETNRCPCCGGKAWYVGRVTAECAACDAALPLAQKPGTGDPVWEAKPEQ